VLGTARKCALFDSKEWLSSDRGFHTRSHPNCVSDYDAIIRKMARRYGFDWRLIAAQIYVESRFRSSAQSHVGARGLMQVLPSTAAFLGFDSTLLLDPQVNIAVGCRYDQRMYSLWGRQTTGAYRLPFALASYNAGRGRVLRSYSTERNRTTWDAVCPLLPRETRMYVHKIYLKYDLYTRHLLP
jgi:membrane-bound lytic murein transglycosylase F